MNKKRLSNLATALEDAQKNEHFVSTFTFESWGYPRDEYDRLETIQDAFFTNDPDHNETFDVDWINHHIEAEFEDVKLIPHNCGAPACALGHFALRTDLQEDFKLDTSGALYIRSSHEDFQDSFTSAGGVCDGRISEYFDISTEEASSLFGTNGCDGAETPGAAADYIREFIK